MPNCSFWSTSAHMYTQAGHLSDLVSQYHVRTCLSMFALYVLYKSGLGCLDVCTYFQEIYTIYCSFCVIFLSLGYVSPDVELVVSCFICFIFSFLVSPNIVRTYIVGLDSKLLLIQICFWSNTVWFISRNSLAFIIFQVELPLMFVRNAVDLNFSAFCNFQIACVHTQLDCLDSKLLSMFALYVLYKSGLGFLDVCTYFQEISTIYCSFCVILSFTRVHKS